MSTLKVYDVKGASVGAVDVADDLLVSGRGDQAVYEVVTAYRAGLRAGTASTKTKGEVAGSNRKPWRQKGLGLARAGCRRSPIWKGGGTAFGPHPRSYAQHVNRKVARLAFQRVLSDKVSGDGIRIVEGLESSNGKTREVAGILKALKIAGPVLMVVDAPDAKLERACRNLKSLELIPARHVNVYHVLRYPVIVATRTGFDALKARLEGKSSGGKE